MKPVYDIKFLSGEDFDRLPKTETNGSDISDSLGFYNPHTNRIFIRYTAYPELNKYLLDHEFEHLLEKDATDEDENGIRHKKGKSLLKALFLPLGMGGYGIGGDNSKSSIKAGNAPENQKDFGSSQMGDMGGMFGNSMQNMGQSQISMPQSSFSDQQQSSQSGLNQGLNQQSINPLQDPYAKFGQQQGRLYF